MIHKKIIVFYWEGVNKHHCKMTVLGLRWVEAIQREGGRGVKIDCPLLNLLSVTGMVNLINSGN